MLGKAKVIFHEGSCCLRKLNDSIAAERLPLDDMVVDFSYNDVFVLKLSYLFRVLYSNCSPPLGKLNGPSNEPSGLDRVPVPKLPTVSSDSYSLS